MALRSCTRASGTDSLIVHWGFRPAVILAGGLTQRGARERNTSSVLAPLYDRQALRPPTRRGGDRRPLVVDEAQKTGGSRGELALGCAGLMRLPSMHERSPVIGAGRAIGVRHFDVARIYGLGAAERELGDALRGARAGVTSATKLGIEPRSVAQRLARLREQRGRRWRPSRRSDVHLGRAAEGS